MSPKSSSEHRLTFTLLIPVLNEEESLPYILPLIRPEWVDEIIFIDGGSRDRTVEIIRNWGQGELFIQNQPGLEMAYFETFPKIKTDFIISYSPDGNSLPEAIPELVQKIREGYDMVIASRYLAGAGSEDDDVMTAFGNWMFTKTINILFGGKFTDTLVMLRAYRASLIPLLEMQPLRHCFEPQLAIRCAVHQVPYAEIPAREPKRIGGIRKMRVFANGWGILKMIVKEWLRLLKLKIQRRL